MLGEVVGNYKIVRELGKGVVYVAEHTLLHSRVVVKMLHADLSQREELVERFFNEAKATTAHDRTETMPGWLHQAQARSGSGLVSAAGRRAARRWRHARHRRDRTSMVTTIPTGLAAD